jgi:hypothetical protein
MANRYRKSATEQSSVPVEASAEHVQEATAKLAVAPEAEQAEQPNATRKSAVSAGAQLAVLAGRPSKPAVIAVFGKRGYTLSWVQRAIRLDVSPEELCQKFKADPQAVKAQWEALTATKA